MSKQQVGLWNKNIGFPCGWSSLSLFSSVKEKPVSSWHNVTMLLRTLTFFLKLLYFGQQQDSYSIEIVKFSEVFHDHWTVFWRLIWNLEKGLQQMKRAVILIYIGRKGPCLAPSWHLCFSLGSVCHRQFQIWPEPCTHSEIQSLGWLKGMMIW